MLPVTAGSAQGSGTFAPSQVVMNMLSIRQKKCLFLIPMQLLCLGHTNLIFCVTDFFSVSVTRQGGKKKIIILQQFSPLTPYFMLLF
jgi:hypothetical protein